MTKLKQKVKGKIKIAHGIKQRWLFNNLVPMVAILVLAVIALSLLIVNYYYSSVRTGIENKAKATTDFLSSYIESTSVGYYDSAYQYIADYEDINKLELQFIDSTGRVEISSYSLATGVAPGTSDITTALETGNIGVWIGRNAGTNEHIMAVSSPIMFSDGRLIGVMRYVTNLNIVDREIFLNILVFSAGAILIILLILLTNMFFIRSVVEPISEITAISKRIADGSYGVQIGKKYKDEIGDMVDAINEMSTKVSSAEKTQTEFISSVSHELRTPLTAITGWGETLIYDESLDDDAKRGIGIILKEARRLTKLVEELLDFTRMQDGRFTLNIEQIDVGVEIEDSIFTYKELLKQDEIELDYEPYPDELPLINGDSERLKQVFLNLLDNASKYARAGKHIVVSIDMDSEDILIKIRDFGPGIPEDELENVKMKFYKGSSSKERGSGIGLAVCDEIVRYHGGDLLLSNAPGGGLLVTIKLPIDTHI